MKIRLARPNDASFQTMTVTYPAAGLILPAANPLSSRIERNDTGAGVRRHHDSLGARFVAFCCECLARMVEMDVASEPAGADSISRSQQRTLERISEDKSWARLDSEEPASRPAAASGRSIATLRSEAAPRS
jgi:hypothetical protein